MHEQLKSIFPFIEKHSQFFIDIISLFYPLNKEQMIYYKEHWNWEKISQNKNINWDIETINEVKDYLDWSLFTINSSAFKDSQNIHEFYDLIDWVGVNGYEDESISANTGMNWSDEFIEQHQKALNFYTLSSNESIPWSEQLIEKYKDKWNFKKLAMNNAVPWSIALFEKYLDTSYFFYYDVQANKRFISNVEFIEKYKNYMDWSLVFANPNLLWQELQLFERWDKYIDWYGVARNPIFFENDNKFFRNNYDRWLNLAKKSQGKAISQNMALPWSIDFIKQHKALWDWEILSTNTALPWNAELIEIFSDELIWGGSQPAALYSETGEFISSTGGETYESGLVQNEVLPWSMDFIKYFEEHIDFEALAENEGVYNKAFKSLLNDDIINYYLNILLA